MCGCHLCVCKLEGELGGVFKKSVLSSTFCIRCSSEWIYHSSLYWISSDRWFLGPYLLCDIVCVCVFEQAFLVTKAALGEVGGEPARDKVPVHRQPCHTEVPDYRIHRNLVLLHRTVRRPPVSLAFISEVTKIASVSFSALRCWKILFSLGPNEKRQHKLCAFIPLSSSQLIVSKSKLMLSFSYVRVEKDSPFCLCCQKQRGSLAFGREMYYRGPGSSVNDVQSPEIKTWGSWESMGLPRFGAVMCTFALHHT